MEQRGHEDRSQEVEEESRGGLEGEDSGCETQEEGGEGVEGG